MKCQWHSRVRENDGNVQEPNWILPKTATQSPTVRDPSIDKTFVQQELGRQLTRSVVAIFGLTPILVVTSVFKIGQGAGSSLQQVCAFISLVSISGRFFR